MSPLGNGNRSTVLITNQLREILYFYDEILQYLVTVIVAIYPKGHIISEQNGGVLNVSFLVISRRNLNSLFNTTYKKLLLKTKTLSAWPC